MPRTILNEGMGNMHSSRQSSSGENSPANSQSQKSKTSEAKTELKTNYHTVQEKMLAVQPGNHPQDDLYNTGLQLRDLAVQYNKSTTYGPDKKAIEIAATFFLKKITDHVGKSPFHAMNVSQKGNAFAPFISIDRILFTKNERENLQHHDFSKIGHYIAHQELGELIKVTEKIDDLAKNLFLINGSVYRDHDHHDNKGHHYGHSKHNHHHNHDDNPDGAENGDSTNPPGYPGGDTHSPGTGGGPILPTPPADISNIPGGIPGNTGDKGSTNPLPPPTGAINPGGIQNGGNGQPPTGGLPSGPLPDVIPNIPIDQILNPDFIDKHILEPLLKWHRSSAGKKPNMSEHMIIHRQWEPEPFLKPSQMVQMQKLKQMASTVAMMNTYTKEQGKYIDSLIGE